MSTTLPIELSSTQTSSEMWPDEAYLRAVFQVTVLENPWIPHDPTPKQAEFLLLPVREALFGGAAGGGKSDALLMAALQYAEIPGYKAILFRRTYQDLALPGALMDRANAWLRGTKARWDEKEHTWHFPSGASLTFGYLELEKHKYRYQGAEFQFIGFDELTQFSESQYRYLFSRLRRLQGTDVPLRMRAASNPGGMGHDWVKARFPIEGDDHIRDGCAFVPAKLDDNPHLDRDSYLGSLAQLDPVTREQLRNGDWSARPEGKKFRREWFTIVDSWPRDAKQVRFWDQAATKPKPGQDPDWTTGCRMAEKQGQVWIVDMRRTQATPLAIERLTRQTAELDGRDVDIWIEQEPGSSGVNTIDRYTREVLKGFTARGNKTTGSKESRANPLSAAAEAGNVFLVRGPWNAEFLDEICAFPTEGVHDDQVDAASGAFLKLTGASTSFESIMAFYHAQRELKEAEKRG